MPVRLAPVLVQPMAAEDVATAVAKVAVGAPVNGIIEVGGQSSFAWTTSSADISAHMMIHVQ
jgi:hypothetical protein